MKSVVDTQTPADVLCSLPRNSGPYLCGHYHTVFNIAEQMYYMHDGNSLELELGDFKKNRKYRVLAVDNGLLSFVDVEYGKFPVILVTNPKDAMFHLPGYEPTHRIALSTHIRVLVFTDEAEIDVSALRLILPHPSSGVTLPC